MSSISRSKYVRIVDSARSPTWSYIMDIITINVQHLDTINFFGHNDMDMMEVGMCIRSPAPGTGELEFFI